MTPVFREQLLSATGMRLGVGVSVGVSVRVRVREAVVVGGVDHVLCV